MVKIATQCINFFVCINVAKFAIPVWRFSPHCVAKFIIQHKLQNSIEVDNVGIIDILSMSYITTRIVKTQTSVAKIPSARRIVYFDTTGQNGRLAHCKCENVALTRGRVLPFYPRAIILHPRAIILHPSAIILRTGARKGHFRCL